MKLMIKKLDNELFELFDGKQGEIFKMDLFL